MRRTRLSAARSLLALAVSIALSLLLSMLLPGWARAGGPTSAIIVSPADGATGAVYYSDEEYQDLMSLLGAGPAESAGTAGSAATSGGTGPASSSGDSTAARDNEIRTGTGDYVTITWLIHDVAVWRVDQVYFDGGEPALIRTQQSADFGSVNADPFDPDAGQLHRVSNPKLLGDLLDRLLGRTDPTDAAAAAVVAGGEPPTRSTLGEGGWAGAGLLVGAIGSLLAVLAVLAVLRWRRRTFVDDADPGPLPVIMMPD